MDNKQFFDIRKPGTTAANPSSKPVITNPQTPVADPMFTTSPTQIQVNDEIAPSQSLDLVSNDPTQNTVSPQAAMPDSSNQSPVASSPVNNFSDVGPATPGLNPPTGYNQPSDNQPADQTGHVLSHDQAFYGQMKKPSKLKKFFIFLLVLILIGGGGFAGWYFLVKKKATPAPAVSVTPTTTTDTTIDNSTTTDAKIVVNESTVNGVYKNPNAGYQLSNLYDWKIAQKTKSDKSISVNPGDTVVDIAINDTQVVTLVTTKNYGSDSECQPKKTDKAFQKGNECNSYQILKADNLPETAVPKAKLIVEDDFARVIKFDYQNPLNGDKKFTFVGLESSSTKSGLKVGKAVMNGADSTTIIYLKDGRAIFLSTHLKNSQDVAQLSDKDLDKLYKVLQTFKLIEN